APQLVRREKSAWQKANATNGSLAANPALNSAEPQPLFTTDQGGTTPTLHIVGPSDLAKIYNIQPLWDAGIDGTNQTIAIVSDSDIDPNDVDNFRSTFGLP